MNKYGFVYIWRDKGKNRWYIGCHWGREDDRYICGSTWCRNSIKRRPHDFRKRILFRCTTKEELWDKEFEWLSLIKQEDLGKKYYNLRVFHYDMDKKLSQRKYKKGTVVWNKGNHWSEEHKKKLSEAHFGQIAWNKGKKLSKEHKENLSKNHWSKGENSEEIKKKVSKPRYGHENHFFGKTHSEESKKKMSESRKKYLESISGSLASA